MDEIWDIIEDMPSDERIAAMRKLSASMDAAGHRLNITLRPQHYCAIVAAITVCLDSTGSQLSEISRKELQDTLTYLHQQLQWAFPAGGKN